MGASRWLVGFALMWPAWLAAGAPPRIAMPLVFVAPADNDLVRAVPRGSPAERHATAAAAVDAAPEGAGLLLLDGAAVDEGLLRRAAARRLRVYVEEPAAFPGVSFSTPRRAGVERGVVASDFAAPGLPRGRILGLGSVAYRSVAAEHPWLVLARVAGLDTAVFGLPETAVPLLFEARPGVLVATAPLSRFVAGRYAPAEAWEQLWEAILGWLRPGTTAPKLVWSPTVRPTFGRRDRLPRDVEAAALKRGADWFLRAGLLLPPEGPPGEAGIEEGFGASLSPDGSQPRQTALRGDCHGESAMGLAFGGEPAEREAAGRLLDFWWFRSVAQQGKRADPQHPAFGLAAWGVSSWAWEKAFYGDDNARLLLGTAATAALLDTDRWDVAMLKCLLGNLRTTGWRGFRNGRIDLPELEEHGWRWYFDRAPAQYQPHYQAYLWACYLWAAERTGYALFRERAERALGLTMEGYPDRWRWTNGFAQERARMLLPLAWLVRVDDTPEHRAWLRRVAEDLLKRQGPEGAIREELGPPGRGDYGPPASNEAFGTNEATLIQANGDPVSDLLYTTNFAFLGLHEAAAATGDRYYRDAEERLAKFLCRIQVRSEVHPELDGAWYRAFDDRRWDYWASNADAGWGAWSIETGWTQGWITAVLGLRQQRTSLWELLGRNRIGAHLAGLQPLFFPDGDQAAGQGVTHLAVDRPVKLATPPSPSYAGGAPDALTDGERGTADYLDPAWQGWEGPDLEAVADLGRARAIRRLRLGCLQQVRLGIFLPSAVEYAVSDDGRSYRVVATVTHGVPEETPGPVVHDFAAELPEPVRARWVRVHARSLGTIPAWHAAAGLKAWLFADELLVE
ncbi:MAG: discoidin domain-containing protein [Armatimonadetes bacterium]|nr:discoidin domain-containing protein [Armatimonadota bacterium]